MYWRETDKSCYTNVLLCLTLKILFFCCCLVTGIVAFRIFPFHRRTRKALHAVIHLMVLLIAAIGLVAVFQNHQVGVQCCVPRRN